MQAFRKLYVDRIRLLIDRISPNVDEIRHFFVGVSDERKIMISADGEELIFCSSLDGFRLLFTFARVNHS